jgi:hypothetical protein
MKISSAEVGGHTGGVKEDEMTALLGAFAGGMIVGMTVGIVLMRRALEGGLQRAGLLIGEPGPGRRERTGVVRQPISAGGRLPFPNVYHV